MIPDSYEGPEARERIEQGLQSRGVQPGLAVRSADMALREAPFAPPDPDSWAWVCQRARQVARAGGRIR